MTFDAADTPLSVLAQRDHETLWNDPALSEEIPLVEWKIRERFVNYMKQGEMP